MVICVQSYVKSMYYENTISYNVYFWGIYTDKDIKID